MKKELDLLIEEKRKNFLPADVMLTHEHLTNLKLGSQQIQKLIMQQPSPTKYQNAKLNVLSSLLDEDGYKQQ